MRTAYSGAYCSQPKETQPTYHKTSNAHPVGPRKRFASGTSAAQGLGSSPVPTYRFSLFCEKFPFAMTCSDLRTALRRPRFPCCWGRRQGCWRVPSYLLPGLSQQFRRLEESQGYCSPNRYGMCDGARLGRELSRLFLTRRSTG